MLFLFHHNNDDVIMRSCVGGSSQNITLVNTNAEGDVTHLPKCIQSPVICEHMLPLSSKYLLSSNSAICPRYTSSSQHALSPKYALSLRYVLSP